MKLETLNRVLLSRVSLSCTMRLANVGLSLHDNERRRRRRPSILLEDGFHLLLETGKRLLMEKRGSVPYDPIVQKSGYNICLENGNRLILENGCALLLEHS